MSPVLLFALLPSSLAPHLDILSVHISGGQGLPIFLLDVLLGISHLGLC